MNKELLKELENALTFLGQAQELAENSSPLWCDIGEMYDDLDSLILSIREGDYDGD